MNNSLFLLILINCKKSMIGEGKFVQVAGSGGIEIFFVGKKVP
jgi:hypothetical protein